MTAARQMVIRLILRWGFNSFGLWLSAVIIPQVTFNGGLRSLMFAGLLLSAVNAIIKPLLVILSLPVILFTLGLFTLVVNGVLIMLTDWLAPGLSIDGFIAAVLAGMVLSLINYSLTAYLEERIFFDEQ